MANFMLFEKKTEVSGLNRKASLVLQSLSVSKTITRLRNVLPTFCAHLSTYVTSKYNKQKANFRFGSFFWSFTG